MLAFMKHSVWIVALLALSACGGDVRESLGLTRESPDEFVVVSRPPLAVPPEFKLIPPEPGKQGPRHSTEDMAKSALFGEDDKGSVLDTKAGVSNEFTLEGFSPETAPISAVVPVLAVDTGSAATSNFLSRTGAEEADPEIRTKLGEDLRAEKPEAKEEAGSLYEQLIGADQEEPVIDAKGEAERLRSNKDTGKKPNDGDVVTEDKKEKSVLDSLW